VLGRDYETSILVDDYTDGQMVQMLANENSASEGASLAEQVDMVIAAHKWLKANVDSCKTARPTTGRTNMIREGCFAEKPEYGGCTCITAFLGEANWSRSKVRRCLEMAGQSRSTNTVFAVWTRCSGSWYLGETTWKVPTTLIRSNSGSRPRRGI
jgi:hypothetical protein